MPKKRSTITLNKLDKLPPAVIGDMENTHTVLINSKITPELGFQLLDILGNKSVSGFIRVLIKQYMNGTSPTTNTPENNNTTSIPEYFTMLHQLFGKLFNSKKGRESLLAAMKELEITPQKIQQLQDEVF